MWKRRLWRIAAPTFILLLFCAIQTIVWPNFFGSIPAPPLWILLLTWLSLYRPESTTILLVYFLGFLAAAFSAIPLKMLFSSLLILHVVITFARERIFWSGSSYFILAATSSVALYQIIYLSLSAILEPVHSAWLPLERLAQILWAVPFSTFVYRLMNWLEWPLHPETAIDDGGQA